MAKSTSVKICENHPVIRDSSHHYPHDFPLYDYYYYFS